MSTPAAIVLTAYALGMAVLFACTRNGRHLARVIAIAVHHRLVPATGVHRHKDRETGEVAPEEIVSVRDALRDLAIAGYWHARYWAGRPRLWRQERRIRTTARGCVQTPLLAAPETLPLRVADPEPEEVPAPAATPPGRGRAPYPLRETSPQAALTLPDTRWIPETDYAPYTPQVIP